ncbi:MAG: hypothetical protein WCP06_13075 [Verrucomicrobiota bacterium]
MIRPFLILALCLATMASALAAQPVPRLLQKADVLPLALDDSFAFRKHTVYLNDAKKTKSIKQPMMAFEPQHYNYGTTYKEERAERNGHYFKFWWRAQRTANLTVRLEYRQQNLGAYVQAQEIDVPAAKGTIETKFQVTGDDFNDDGQVLAWRALLIENGKIVALTQSFLWH